MTALNGYLPQTKQQCSGANTLYKGKMKQGRCEQICNDDSNCIGFNLNDVDRRGKGKCLLVQEGFNFEEGCKSKFGAWKGFELHKKIQGPSELDQCRLDLADSEQKFLDLTIKHDTMATSFEQKIQDVTHCTLKMKEMTTAKEVLDKELQNCKINLAASSKPEAESSPFVPGGPWCGDGKVAERLPTFSVNRASVTKTIPADASNVVVHIGHSDVHPAGSASIKFNYADSQSDTFRFRGNGGNQFDMGKNQWSAHKHTGLYTTGNEPFLKDMKKSYEVENLQHAGQNVWQYRPQESGVTSIELQENANWAGLKNVDIAYCRPR